MLAVSRGELTIAETARAGAPLVIDLGQLLYAGPRQFFPRGYEMVPAAR